MPKNRSKRFFDSFSRTCDHLCMNGMCDLNTVRCSKGLKAMACNANMAILSNQLPLIWFLLHASLPPRDEHVT